MSEPDHRGVALVGEILDGAYQLTRLISEGGMGTVYEAVQLRLNKRVAVKVMTPELAANPEALARFRREVDVTSQLSHPHIISLLDFGTTPQGQPYLVMEFLDGEDLEKRILRVGYLPVAAALDVVKQVASALAAIHAKGVVHRDLKPANVFLLPLDGAANFVKLVDFGISKVRTAETKLTRAFTMMGTPEFMAPEQATGRVDDVDHRSDQWALGCLAWLMISGTNPFWAADLNTVLRHIVNRDPAPLDPKEPNCPMEVEQVLRRALAKNQADRFPTITAFSRAFEAAATAPPVVGAAMPEPRSPEIARSSAKSRRHGLGWALAVGALVSLAVGAAIVYREGLIPGLAPSSAIESEKPENSKPTPPRRAGSLPRNKAKP